LPGSTDAEIQQRISDFLHPMGLTTYNVELVHSTPEDATETVHVTIPYADVTLVGGFFGPTNYNLGARCSMRKEAAAGS
jgi:molybdopterin-biosynthesis enzyme MoeA-like protein